MLEEAARSESDPYDAPAKLDPAHIVKSLPTTLQSSTVVQTMGHVLRVLSPADFNDAELAESCSFASGSQGPGWMQSVFASVGKSALAKARKFSLQRSIDAGLASELAEVNEEFQKHEAEKTSTAVAATTVDQQTVGARCTVKSLARWVARLDGVTAKASPEFTRSNGEVTPKLRGGIAAATQLLLIGKKAGVFQLLKTEPFTLVKALLLREQI